MISQEANDSQDAKALQALQKELHDLYDAKVDLIIAAWPLEERLYEILSARDNQDVLKAIRKKVVPVLPHDDFKNHYRSIENTGYGGVGIWTVDQQEGAEWEGVIKNEFRKNFDYMKLLQVKFLPICKLICPHPYVRNTMVILISLFVLYLVLSFFLFEFQKYLNMYPRSLLAGGVITILLSMSLVFCVPFWKGLRTYTTLAVAIIAIVYFAKRYFWPKEENYS